MRDCEFLQLAAYITDIELGTTYVTLSISTAAFKLRIKGRRRALDSKDEAIKCIAQRMLRKLQEYEALVGCELSNFAYIVDTRFSNDYQCDDDHLRILVDLPKERQTAEGIKNSKSKSQSLFFQFLEVEYSRDAQPPDVVADFSNPSDWRISSPTL